MKDTVILTAGVPMPRLVYAWEGEVERLHNEIKLLKEALRPFGMVEWAQDRWHPELKISLDVQGTSVAGEYLHAADFRLARTLAASEREG